MCTWYTTVYSNEVCLILYFCRSSWDGMTTCCQGSHCCVLLLSRIPNSPLICKPVQTLPALPPISNPCLTQLGQSPLGTPSYLYTVEVTPPSIQQIDSLPSYRCPRRSLKSVWVVFPWQPSSLCSLHQGIEGCLRTYWVAHSRSWWRIYPQAGRRCVVARNLIHSLY